MKLLRLLPLLAALTVAPAYATIVYSNNFDTPATTSLGASSTFTAAGGGTTTTVAPYAATYGSIFRNSSTGLTQLTLSGLPTHTGISLSYVLAFLDSWDSNVSSSFAPDNLDFYIDGVLVDTYTYNNASGPNKYAGGGTVIAEYVQFDSNIFFSDSVVDMTTDPGLSFAHTASSITFAWQASGAGWQGSTDEAWGIDNLVVDLRGVGVAPPPAGVPEPATWALLGLAGVGGSVLRRRRQR